MATDFKANITTLPANLRPAGATTAMNFTWDSDNNLRSADIDANGTADVNFQYDARGRRVAGTGTGGSVVYMQMDQQTIADYPVDLGCVWLTPQVSSLTNRYTSAAREWDATLGLHHLRAIWMSPSAGRFPSRDPNDKAPERGSQAAIHPKTAEANHRDAETRR